MMNRRHILVVLVALPLLMGACAGTTSAPTAAPTAVPTAAPSGTPDSAADDGARTSDDGQVTLGATWAGPTAGATFDIKVDTHTVDLDSLDLADATLRNNRGETLRARPWAAPTGGHHREGTLAFDGDAAAFLAAARWIELVIPGIGGGTERVLRWEIGAVQ